MLPNYQPKTYKTFIHMRLTLTANFKQRHATHTHVTSPLFQNENIKFSTLSSTMFSKTTISSEPIPTRKNYVPTKNMQKKHLVDTC